MKNNKKGAALMQVLLITVILAGIATMLLRATLSRTTSAYRMRRTVSAQMLVQACMAQVNTLWSKKSAAAFQRDLNGLGNDGVPYMYCSGEATDISTCPKDNIEEEYVCTIANPYDDSNPYTVKAYFGKDVTATSESGVKMWQMVYEVTGGLDTL